MHVSQLRFGLWKSGSNDREDICMHESESLESLNLIKAINFITLKEPYKHYNYTIGYITIGIYYILGCRLG